MFGNDCTSHANDPECAGGKLDSVGKFSWYQLSRNEIGCDNPCFEQFSKNTPFSDYLFTGVQIAKVPGVLRPRSARKIWAASDEYSFNRTAGAGVGRQLRVAHIENKGWLPCGVCSDFVEQRDSRGRSA